MASSRDFTQVHIEGLRELKRDLRRLEPQVRAELRTEAFRKAANIVAAEARTLVPVRTGRLRASIKGTTSGFKGVVRSPLPYANVIHWGGTTGRGHSRTRPGSVRVKGSFFITRALDRKRGQVEDQLLEGIHDVARRNGWL